MNLAQRITRLLGIDGLKLTMMERRWNLRVPAEFEAMLAIDGISTRVRGIDIGRGGVGVLSAESLAVGADVFLRAPELGFMGFAQVRHCTRVEGGGYRLGMQFRDRLHREPSADAGRRAA